MIKDTKAWDQIVAKLNKLSDIKIRVGVWAGAGTKQDADKSIDLVDLAIIHEFGAGPIPARPFIRGAFEHTPVQVELAAFQARLIRNYISNRVDTKQAAELLGLWAATAVKNFVKLGASPLRPLSPVTIKKKKSSRPLVDTGQLINAVTYVVVA